VGVGGGGGAEWWCHLQPLQHGALERIDEAILLVMICQADGREVQPVGE
jgi:hypothetical protein